MQQWREILPEWTTGPKYTERFFKQRLNDREKKLLFKLRSKTLDVKKNFGNHDNPWCTSCGIFEETQAELRKLASSASALAERRGPSPGTLKPKNNV